MSLFLDTSAFAKRYIAESGSDQVLALCRDAEQLAVSVICLPEMLSTLNRLVRERRLTAARYASLKRRVLNDLADADICELTTEVMAEVIHLLEDHALRPLDTIHIACAVAYQADQFASADRHQMIAARETKLKVIDIA